MARLVDKIVGHKEQIELLSMLRQSGRWPHALLFSGPSGIGKRKIALAFAQMLICPEQPGACGICGACLRVEKEQSESLILLSPDPELSKKVIKVDAVRELLDSLSLVGIGRARVVIIDQADTMNSQAANALLKTLEEPFENVFFVLIGREVQSFLPTIRSRSQVMRFAPLSYDDLRAIKPELPDWAYRSSRGQLDQLQLLTSQDGMAKREEALTLFEQFCEDPQFLLDSVWKSQVKDRAQAQFNIKCWLQLIRDLLILKTQAQQFVLNTDQVTRLKKLYQIHSQQLTKLSENLILAERALYGNADPVLVFENLWVKYDRVD